jgi:LacI family transcriptional regulator
MGTTLKDIAEYCGVSSATVSMIINGKSGRISDDTIRRVEDAVRHLGYTPNIAARSMVTKQSKTIGLTIPDISDYFFSELAKGVGDEADEHGYDLLIGNTGSKLEKEKEYIQVFQGRSVDGIIFAPLNSCEENDLFQELQKKHYPFVTIERYIKDQVPGVFMKNFQGAYDLTRLMIEKGHRKIAFITGPLCTASAFQRLSGYKAACRSMNITVDEQLIFPGDFSYESGNRAGKEFFDERECTATAILASNNRMALGFYEEILAHGLSVPEDLSIAGIGGARFYPVLNPKITTIDMPIYDLGREAAKLLFHLLKGEEIKKRAVEFDLNVLDLGSIRDLNIIR